MQKRISAQVGLQIKHKTTVNVKTIFVIPVGISTVQIPNDKAYA